MTDAITGLMQEVKRLKAELAKTATTENPPPGTSFAPSDAQFVTLTVDATLTNERTLAVTAPVTKTDGGAGSDVTIAVSAASESATGVIEIATQAETNTGTDDARAVTPAKLAGRTASETQAGVIEIATQAETNTGTDDARAITPLKLATRAASETLAGMIELATQAETNTGTDDARAMTPLKAYNAYRNNGICQGRLTLTTAVPVTVSDVTAAATIYFTPTGKGNRISLYDGSNWQLYSLSEVNVAVPSTIYKSFDIFIYDNSGTLTLETIDWNQTTGTVAGATNASPIVITSNLHGLSTGDIVGISGVNGNTAANNVWVITNTATDTFSLDNSTGNGAYTSGGNWYKLNGITRATAITLQDGVYVKSGATTRRYLGTGRTGATSGQTEDSLTKRLLWNYYNRTPRQLRKFEDSNTVSWTYTTATFRPANNVVNNRIEIAIGVQEAFLDLTLFGLSSNTGTNGRVIGIGKNQYDGNDSDFHTQPNNADRIEQTANLKEYPAIGNSIYWWVELSGAGTTTFFGTGSTAANLRNGLNGTIEG